MVQSPSEEAQRWISKAGSSLKSLQSGKVNWMSPVGWLRKLGMEAALALVPTWKQSLCRGLLSGRFLGRVLKEGAWGPERVDTRRANPGVRVDLVSAVEYGSSLPWEIWSHCVELLWKTHCRIFHLRHKKKGGGDVFTSWLLSSLLKGCPKGINTFKLPGLLLCQKGEWIPFCLPTAAAEKQWGRKKDFQKQQPRGIQYKGTVTRGSSCPTQRV